LTKMNPQHDMIDQMVVLIANLINLVLVAIFICRKLVFQRLEYFLGIGLILLIFPVAFAVYLNLKEKRNRFLVLLPIPLILFLLVELFFDYIFHLPFRETNLLWLYLGVYYLGLLGMIGYAFVVRKMYGYMTLVTYFLNLLATWYAHSS